MNKIRANLSIIRHILSVVFIVATIYFIIVDYTKLVDLANNRIFLCYLGFNIVDMFDRNSYYYK